MWIGPFLSVANLSPRLKWISKLICKNNKNKTWPGLIRSLFWRLNLDSIRDECYASYKNIPSKSMYFGCNQPSQLALSGTCRHPSWLSNSRFFCRISAAGKSNPLNYFLVKRSPLLNVYRTSKESARHENLPLSTMHSLMLDSLDCDESRSQN